MSFACPECAETLNDLDLFCCECGARFDDVAISAPEKGILDITNIQSDSDENNHVFQVEWNCNASMFLADHTSSFQFRISPLNPDAKNVSNIRLFLRYPHSHEFKEEKILYKSITNQVTVNVNFCPSTADCGVNQNVDFCLSYSLDGKDFWFGHPILVDIYSERDSKEKVFENINIKLDNISSDRASDLKLNLLDNFNPAAGKDPFELLERFKKSVSWQRFELNEMTPLESADVYTSLLIPPAPSSCHSKLTLRLNDGELVHLYESTVTLGRNKTNDIMTRNLHAPGEPAWSGQKLRQMNCRISGDHCRISVSDDRAVIDDTQSSNGTYLNGNRINSITSLSESDTLSLAVPNKAPENFKVSVCVIQSDLASKSLNEHLNILDNICAGVILRRSDRVKESYYIVNKWLPLDKVNPSLSNQWLICRKDNNYAITNGSTWTWLTPDSSVPHTSGIHSVINQSQYKG